MLYQLILSQSMLYQLIISKSILYQLIISKSMLYQLSKSKSMSYQLFLQILPYIIFFNIFKLKETVSRSLNQLLEFQTHIGREALSHNCDCCISFFIGIAILNYCLAIMLSEISFPNFIYQLMFDGKFPDALTSCYNFFLCCCVWLLASLCHQEYSLCIIHGGVNCLNSVPYRCYTYV